MFRVGELTVGSKCANNHRVTVNNVIVKFFPKIIKQFQLFLICFHCTGSKRIIKKVYFRPEMIFKNYVGVSQKKGPKLRTRPQGQVVAQRQYSN
jgi:hypothetical protein